MIAGLDPSTARIGWATAERLHSITPTAGPDDRARRLYELAGKLRVTVTCWPPRPALVVLEGPAQHSPGPLAMIRQGEVRGVILRELFTLAVPFVEVTPSSVKRFATGRGNADKAAMIAAARQLGADPANDDEADAFHLRRFGLAAYGSLDHLEGHELDAIANAGVDWPNLDPGETT